MNPIAVSVPEAARLLGIGRTLTYDLLASGELLAVKIGRRTLVPTDQLSLLIAQRSAESPAA